MKQSRSSEEEIVAILKEQQAGVPMADVCRRRGVSSAITQAKANFGGLEVWEGRRVRQLEDENRPIVRDYVR